MLLLVIFSSHGLAEKMVQRKPLPLQIAID